MSGDGNKTGLRAIVENSEDMAAIGNILAALEGMQEQMAAATDLIISQDKRIKLLTKRIEKLEMGSAPVIDIRNRLRDKSGNVIRDNT